MEVVPGVVRVRINQNEKDNNDDYLSGVDVNKNDLI